MNRSAGKEVSLVLPCLNEEAAVGQCVEHALSVMREAGLDGCVIVVDNGSTDRSVEVARNAGAIVIYQSQPGYGAALRSGFEYSQATYCVMADADGTYEFEALARVLHPVMNDDADLVLGSRLGVASLVALVANSLSAQLRLSHPVANIWTLATVSTLAAGLGMFAISLLGPLVGEVNLRVLPDAMPAYDFDRDYHLAAASGF